MGKPKKGGFPAGVPVTRYVTIQGGTIPDTTIAWGDKIVLVNDDDATYKIVGYTSGQPDSSNVWTTLTPKGTAEANSQEIDFNWTGPGLPPKEPTIVQYGFLPPPDGSAQIVILIKV